MTNDLLKLLELIRNSSNILSIGPMDAIIQKYHDKKIDILPQNNLTYDLIIINIPLTLNLYKLLSLITDDGYIFIKNYGNNPSSDILIDEFINSNLNRVQFSKQLMINGVKDKYLILKYNTTTTKVSTRNDPITIFLVLRRGKETVYDEKYVNATAKSIKSNITYPHEIVCLTESSYGITEVDRIIKFKHDWGKWWGKVELFRDDLTENKHCLFIDLDTVITKNIDDICRLEGEFFGIRDFYNLTTLQTGLMKWEIGEQSKTIYNKFLNEDFSKYINKGDHEWIGSVVKNYNFIQDCMPGYISSFKKHLMYISKNFITPNIICFHGEPRPHSIKYDFITKHWIY